MNFFSWLRASGTGLEGLKVETNANIPLAAGIVGSSTKDAIIDRQHLMLWSNET